MPNFPKDPFFAPGPLGSRCTSKAVNIHYLFYLQSCSIAALLQLERGQATLVKTDSQPALDNLIQTITYLWNIIQYDFNICFETYLINAPRLKFHSQLVVLVLLSK